MSESDNPVVAHVIVCPLPCNMTSKMAASENHSSPDTIETKMIVHFRMPTAGMDCPDLKYERRKMISDPKTAVGIGSCIRLVAEDEGTVDGKICVI